MKVKKINFYFILVLILIVGAGFVFLRGGNSESVDNVVGNGEVQKIILSEKDLNYYPNTIRVKANQPVSISLDNSIQGCLRAFTIKEFGVYKYVKTPEETIDFTPTKKGTFTFACSMGMGYGKIIVE